MKLTLSNFFSTFALDPYSKELDAQDHKKALIASIALGIFTVGLYHAARATANWVVRHHPPGTQTASSQLVNKTLTAATTTKLPLKMTRKQMKNDLDNWVNEAPSESKKNYLQAKKRILEAFDERCTFLDLHELNLKSLPESVGNLLQLLVLRLDNNQLTALPESFGNLSQLKWLNLANNQLTALPESFGNLLQMKKLYLSYNQLISLPVEIGQLQNLIGLDLCDNQLTALPEMIFQLPQNAVISLENNLFPQPATRQALLQRLLGPGYRGPQNIDLGALQEEGPALNVHAGRRDNLTEKAFNLLRDNTTQMSSQDLDKYSKECIQFIEDLPLTDPRKENARHALLGPTKNDEFVSLINTAYPTFPIGTALSTNGEEVTGRLWYFIQNIQDEKDRDIAAQSLVNALAESIEHGRVTCQPGKLQRLLVAVVQGRLEGVHIDQEAPSLTPTQAFAQFMTREEHQHMTDPQALKQAAQQFFRDNPLFRDEELKAAFMRELEQYIENTFE